MKSWGNLGGIVGESAVDNYIIRRMFGTISTAYCQQWTAIRGATCIYDAVFSTRSDPDPMSGRHMKRRKFKMRMKYVVVVVVVAVIADRKRLPRDTPDTKELEVVRARWLPAKCRGAVEVRNTGRQGPRSALARSLINQNYFQVS